MKKILLSTILVTPSLTAFATTEIAMKNCINAWQNKEYVNAITYCKPSSKPRRSLCCWGYGAIKYEDR
ncbi:hypothetical protein CDV26_09450 [Francisella halioticida]|uniref:Uncharacterized protein n=1 Tax=Francisella halioticida TaxID=549298 RepID=A0ABM6M184_9GAMM|nr:hypothetical protein [Francisella halioticida]ASG68588.1 hypothetical protein CDV26_09450 [Francisella halioticida]